MARLGTDILTRRTLLSGAMALLSACSQKSAKTRLALNWKPDPQFGGFYAADYGKHGLDVEILPGGAGTPTIQMVGAGSAEFGIVAADELVITRSRGNNVVALFATFQNSPQGIMVHSSRNLKSIGEVVKGGTLAIQKGLPYARILEKQYGFDKVRVVPSPGGDITAFLNDANFAQQCFLVSEPLAAKRKGADVSAFAVSDLGYNPYTTVLACSGDYLRDNLKTTQAMVAAVREGWRTYLDDPVPVNQKMQQLNPSMAADIFTEVAAAQKNFIETDETRQGGLGIMNRERWSVLIGKLRDLGDITSAVAPEECFKAL